MCLRQRLVLLRLALELRLLLLQRDLQLCLAEDGRLVGVLFVTVFTVVVVVPLPLLALLLVTRLADLLLVVLL